MARVYRRLDEFGIEKGIRAEDEAGRGTEHRDEVIRVAAELRRCWLEEAGSLGELFARAAPTGRRRSFGRKAAATVATGTEARAAASRAPADAAVAQVIQQPPAALGQGVQTDKHKHDPGGQGVRQASLPSQVGGYAKSTGGKTFDGRAMPAWDDLPPRIKEAWREAIAAAIDEPAPKESRIDVQVRLLAETDTVAFGRMLKTMMPPDRGFLLWTVDYGPGGSLAYVSTVSQEDAIRCVREWLRRQEALG